MRSFILILLGSAGAIMSLLGTAATEPWAIAAGAFQIVLTLAAWALWGSIGEPVERFDERPVARPRPRREEPADAWPEAVPSAAAEHAPVD